MENGDMMMTAQVEWKSNGCVSDLYVRWLGGSGGAWLWKDIIIRLYISILQNIPFHKNRRINKKIAVSTLSLDTFDWCLSPSAKIITCLIEL